MAAQYPYGLVSLAAQRAPAAGRPTPERPAPGHLVPEHSVPEHSVPLKPVPGHSTPAPQSHVTPAYASQNSPAGALFHVASANASTGTNISYTVGGVQTDVTFITQPNPGTVGLRVAYKSVSDIQVNWVGDAVQGHYVVSHAYPTAPSSGVAYVIQYYSDVRNKSIVQCLLAPAAFFARHHAAAANLPLEQQYAYLLTQLKA
jgi:hypothetical protein